MPTEPIPILDADNARRDIAADDVGGQRFQVVKTAFGSDGAATMVDASNGLPVAPATAAVWTIGGTVSVANFPSTQVVSGAVTANLGSLGGAATEVKQDAANTQLSTIANRLPTLGLAAPSASQPVTLPTDVVVGSSVGQSALNLDLLSETANGWYDARAFHSASFQIIGSAGISAGAVIFEQTNDPTNAANGVALPVQEATVLNANPQTAAITIAASAVRVFEAPITGGYVRARISTAFIGGTVRIAAVFSELPFAATRLNLQQATAANLAVSIGAALPTGGNTIGSVTAALAPSASQGASTQHQLISSAGTNATSVKTSAGTISQLTLSSTAAAARWFKLYNKASAPTVGTDVPILTFAVPAGQVASMNLGAYGVRCATGIAYALTANPATTDTTAIAANDIVVALSYT